LAAASGRTLVLPPIHQPREHRRQAGVMDSMDADEALDLGMFAPLARTMTFRQFVDLTNSTARLADYGATRTALTFTTIADHRRGMRQKPLRLQPQPTPQLVAAVDMLRRADGCEEGRGRTTSCKFIAYCHLSSCRAQTSRACRHLARGCSRSAQRLPNNYLFAHRVSQLLCGMALPQLGRELTLLEGHQRTALGLFRVASGLRSLALGLAHSLGGYVAVHVRLEDSAKGARTKGVDEAQLPQLLARLLPHLEISPHEITTLYIASNRPELIHRVLPSVSDAVMKVSGGRVRVLGWNALVATTTYRPAGAGAIAAMPLSDLGGLQAALVEHELCVLAPLGFAGSPFSTWANLIGARRWASGHVTRRAYVDLQSGAMVPACAANGTLLSTRT
jgi:hypothetical protein